MGRGRLGGIGSKGERWSATGRTFVLLCRCETEAILQDPVAIPSAEFWIDCRVAMDEGDVLGNLTGAA